jgi:hypothetical protein
MRLWRTVALAGGIALALVATALGHDPDMESKYRLSQKLKSPWITRNGFVADFDAALATATKTGKPIFAYFTVSYMDLRRCERVEEGVLSTPEFKEFGEHVVLFAHINSGLDLPYFDLLREKGGSDVPCFLVMDDQGNVTARVTGDATVKSFSDAVKAGVEFSALRNKADKTADEKAYVLAHEMDLRGIKLQLAKDRIARLGDLSDEQRKLIGDALIRLEIWTAAIKAQDSRSDARAAGKLFTEMWAKGIAPTTDELALPFFTLMLDHAEVASDATLFGRALAELKKLLGDASVSQEFLDEQAERLQRLRKSAREAPDNAE